MSERGRWSDCNKVHRANASALILFQTTLKHTHIHTLDRPPKGPPEMKIYARNPNQIAAGLNTITHRSSLTDFPFFFLPDAPPPLAPPDPLVWCTMNSSSPSTSDMLLRDPVASCE